MDEDLKKLKNALEAQIRRTGSIDDISREKLENLLSCLEMKLREPHDPAHHKGLIEHLEDGMRHFEATHPDLTTIMNDMLVMLGNLGI